MTAGKDLKDASRAIIMLHGRGGSPEDMLPLTEELGIDSFAVFLPRAERNTWYPYSFLVPPEQNQPWLDSALEMIAGLENELLSSGIASENIYFLGFSQGACLSLEYTARSAKRYGGVIAFSGGLIGDIIEREKYKGDFLQTPVFLGSSDPDPHIPAKRVKESGKLLASLNADTFMEIYPGMGHIISREEIDTVNRIFFSAYNF